MSFFFDTNILVYLFDTSSRPKQRRAQELLDQHGPSGGALLSTQVLQEFYVAVTRKLERPLTETDALAALENFTALPIVQIDTEMVISAAQRAPRLQMSFWDALIIESALRGGAHSLLTEDLQHGQKVEGLTIFNPFR